jgi:hypothetical protein
MKEERILAHGPRKEATMEAISTLAASAVLLTAILAAVLYYGPKRFQR